MRRFKILLGFTLSLLFIFALMALSSGKPATDGATEIVDSAVTEEQKGIDLAKFKIYKSRQKELRTALTSYFKKAIASGDIVGAGVSVVHGDSIILSQGFGKKSIDTKAKVDGETIFRLGSLSKGFTGVLAADLEHEGKLKWEDKVRDYLPQFQLGDNTNTNKITLATILSHTSGTPYHSFTNLVEAGLPLTDIAGRFKEVTPISEPGQMYSYQNAMFALSGEILKKATGKELTTLLKQRFFKPLGMRTANTDYETLKEKENIAKPHTKRRNGWSSKPLTDSYDNAVAAGGINASALDMAKWMRFLLGHNPEVLPKSALADAFEPRVDINIGRKYYKRWPGHISSHYGFGWRIHKFEDEATLDKTTMWHHGGSVNNFRNEIAIFPEADLGICVLLNSNSKIARTVIPDLHKLVDGIFTTAPKLSKIPVETAELVIEQ